MERQYSRQHWAETLETWNATIRTIIVTYPPFFPLIAPQRLLHFRATIFWIWSKLLHDCCLYDLYIAFPDWQAGQSMLATQSQSFSSRLMCLTQLQNMLQTKTRDPGCWMTQPNQHFKQCFDSSDWQHIMQGWASNPHDKYTNTAFHEVINCE